MCVIGRTRAAWRAGAGTATLVCAALWLWPAGALAGGIVELTGGVTPGFSANTAPDALVLGRDGHIWFTESADPGGIGRVNGDGTVTELRGGVTPGFSANAHPYDLTVGPDGNIWFTEQGDLPDNGSSPGAIARVNPDLTVTEFRGGATPGFNAKTGPTGITTGPDGNIWFTQLWSYWGQCQHVVEPCGGVARLDPATGTVFQYVAGHNISGLTPTVFPESITTGSDGNIWFTEPKLGDQWQGGLGRFNLGFDNVTEFEGGLTPGFETQTFPSRITSGSGGHVWFTEYGGLGGIAYMNGDGTIKEFGPPATWGMTPSAEPFGIAEGGDGNMWFTEQADPGRVARLNADGTVTELTGGVTGGFSAHGLPTGIAAGPLGRLWFTEQADPGRIAYVNSPTVGTGPASGLQPQVATLTGTVNPNGTPVSDCHFDYGLDTNYGKSISCTGTSLIGGGTAPVAVSVLIRRLPVNSPLQPGTTYHYRLVASNGVGATVGRDHAFTTPPYVWTVSPASGPAVGGNTVTIGGSGFNSGARVSFGANQSTRVTWISSTQLAAVAPAHAAGTVSVVVRNTAGPGTALGAAYTYVAGAAGHQARGGRRQGTLYSRRTS